MLLHEGPDAFLEHRAGVFAGHGQRALAQHPGVEVGAAQKLVRGLFDMLGLAFLDDQQGALPGGKAHEFLFHQRVGRVQHVQGQPRDAEAVGQSEPLQGSKHAVVEAALQHDPQPALGAVDELIQFALPDEAHRGRPAPLRLFLFLRVGMGRQDDARSIAPWRVQRVACGERRPPVIAGNEAAVEVAGADAQHQHHRRIAGLGQFEALLDRVDDAVEPRLGVEQPQLRLHREGVGALLHDAGAFAVILAENDERAALDACRGEVAQRVAGHVGAHRRFPSDRAPQRVVDRSRQSGGGGGFAGARLEAHAQFVENIACVREHVHQVRDGGALVAGHIGHAGLEQRFSDRENAFAAEFLARPQAQQFDFLRERSFGHSLLPRATR